MRSDRRHCYQPDHATLDADGKQAISLEAVGPFLDYLLQNCVFEKALIPRMQAAIRNGMAFLHRHRIRFVRTTVHATGPLKYYII